MAMNVGTDEGNAMADINVTPLVDVMLVLLIIFIITIPVIVAQVHLTLPKATNLPTQTKPENITISVDQNGDLYWNIKKLDSRDELIANLRTLARQDPQPEVHIRGDANVRYMYVGQVLVAAQRIGIRKVAFLTEPDVLGAVSR
jgi:biopolymer transport protein ExbD